MSRLGFKSVIYHGDSCLGEVEIFPAKNQHHFQFPNNEIRINYLSPPSERCPPLSIFQTISPYTIRCKLESKFTSDQSPLYRLYSSCFQELKTAVVLLADEELHLVAMPSKQERFPCFWCCAVPLGLYGNCLRMLNLRCLAIVFDLDETLIVANTMKSFEDKIEALQRRLACEFDPLRVSGMTAELKRYIEDKSLLKQYAEGDFVMDNGRLLKVQSEEVPALPGLQEGFIRPVIRVPERNIVLTRINPEIRDTSVLVRLRPAWEDLRSYLTAKGRKRFEVYVCTMAERDYALEMWRLLDPETHLIGSKQLLDRVVCVKSGSRKSLLNVFQGCICHPKMAMVIDDRLKVWEDKDQPRVHVVPPFTPYYAPQAETANAVPVLCVARNVACNVRAGFFKEFDENLLRKIAELCYEDEVASFPFAPDVSDYMMSEDASFIPNINRDIFITEGMNGIEVERRANQSDDKSTVDSATPLVTNNLDLRPDTSQQPVVIPSVSNGPADSRTDTPLQKPSLVVAGRREVNPSELDYEARRRLLIMHRGQDLREQNLVDSSILTRPTSIQSRGGWLVEEDLNVGHTINGSSELTQESDASDPDKQKTHQNLLHPSVEGFVPPHASQLKNEPAYLGQERQKPNHSQPNPSFLPESDEKAPNQASAKNRQLQTEPGKFILHPPSISIGVLQEIGRKCSSKVEFKSIVNTSKDLQFSVEVLFSGEKIGVGMGKTKKDAQQQAADKALQCLAEKYVAHITDSGVMDRVLDKLSLENENGFLLDTVSPGLDELAKEATLANFSTEAADEELNVSKNTGNQQMLKRANSPRSPHNISSKRSKEEFLRVLPGLPSSQYQKKGSPVS